jgi:hypothetical protein
MELPRRAELLRILLDELTQWLGEYGPYARTLREFDSTLDRWVKRPDRRASIEPILRSTEQELRRRYLAITSDLERFLPYFDEADVGIYRMFQLMEPHEFGEGLEGARLRRESWITAVEQMVDHVGQLRDEVMARLDAMMDDPPAGRSPSGETPADLRPSKTRESEDELLDLETQRPHDDSPPLESSRSVVEDLPVEAPLKKRYLGLITNEGKKSVERLGFEVVVDLVGKRISWALLEALLKGGSDYTPYEDLLDIWDRFGKKDTLPDRSRVADAMYKLREMLKPLGVTIESGGASGWRLAEITRDPEEPA